MTNRAEFRYYYFQHGAPDDAATRALLHDRLFRASAERFEDLIRPAKRGAPVWSEDLLRIVKSAYLADRLSDRERALDHWTRSIDLAVQLVDSTPWEGSALRDIHDLLGTMTGDRWHVSVYPGARRESPPDALFGESFREVTLFSGGLDSTAYAAEAVRIRNVEPFFVGFTAPKLKSRQEAVFRKTVVNPELARRFKPISYLVDGNDRSNRSRGLLFIGTAIYAASVYNAERVVVPENGHLAINPPLTRARLAACSTRSVHPRTLMLINRIVKTVGKGLLRVDNPYLFLSKGEVCRRAAAAGIGAQGIAETVSCGSPPISRRPGSPYHCGYCFPCLVRRAALLASFDVDHTRYEKDFWKLAPTSTISDDVYAVRRWLDRPFTSRDLMADVELPPDTELNGLLRMLEKSRAELAQMIDRVVPGGHPLQSRSAAPGRRQVAS